MKTKAAVLKKPFEVSTEYVQLPSVGPQEVLVKVDACGVCPFDVRLYKGLSKTNYPKILGHEVAGVVVELGAEVSGIKKGESVVVEPAVRCGHCFYCVRGQENLCLNTKWPIGGFSEYTVAPIYNLHRFNGISPREAAFAEPLSCCVNGMTRANLSSGCDVVVVGDGPMGLLHLQLAYAFGAGRVIVTGLLKERLERATKLGAVEALDASTGDVVEKVKAAFDGLGADAVIVAVGSKDAFSTALSLVKRGGTVIQFAGIYPEVDVPIPSRFLHYSEVKLTGSSDSTPHNFATAVKLLESRRVNVSNFVTHTYSIEEAVKAIDTAGNLKGFKVMITN
jgi:L-iditol 2-dehydrogenase